MVRGIWDYERFGAIRTIEDVGVFFSVWQYK
jgi:hypothetical protein